jgi:hypothetical protein
VRSWFEELEFPDGRAFGFLFSGLPPIPPQIDVPADSLFSELHVGRGSARNCDNRNGQSQGFHRVTSSWVKARL